MERNNRLPLINCECPGWTSYCEKILKEEIIDHLSAVKSPQQIFGKYMKLKYPDSKKIVVAVMPCLDKKIESKRKQFCKGKRLAYFLAQAHIPE